VEYSTKLYEAKDHQHTYYQNVVEDEPPPHLCRKDGSVEKLIMQGKVEGRRGGGAQQHHGLMTIMILRGAQAKA